MSFKSRAIRILTSLTLWHILFWLFFCFLFTLQFFQTYLQTGVFEFNKLIPGIAYGVNLALIVYLNYFVFIPRLVAKKMIWQYFFALLISFIVVAILFAITFYGLTGISLSKLNVLSFIALEIVYVIITSFFKFFKEWVEHQGLQLKIMDIEKQKVEAELHALKSQLNPHFLFNVLNSIYSHSLLKSDTAPSIVLKLSELMSYILYDCKTETVPLQKEVEFIKNYIELEKIRLEEYIDVTFSINIANQALVPPLLFVPLIENAFKHGIGSHPKNKYISLTIETHEDTFYFNLRNSKGGSLKPIKNNTKGGIGIENVRKRLKLLYPEGHEMVLTNKEGSFEVEIIINNLNKNNS